MVVGRGKKREAEKHNPKGIVNRKKDTNYNAL